MAPPADDKRLGEQADTLYALYERKAKAFRTALVSVMSLVTIVLALVFYPYVSFRGERYALEAALEKTGRALDDAEWTSDEAARQLREFQEAMQEDFRRLHDFSPDALQAGATAQARALAEVRTALAGDPEALAWLTRARADEAPPDDIRRRHPELRRGGRDPCFWLTGEAWRRCALSESLAEVDNPVVTQLQRGRATDLTRRLFIDLSDAATELRHAFSAYLLSDETTWRLDLAGIAEGMSERHPIFLRTRSGAWAGQLEISGSLQQQTEQYTEYYRQLIEGHEYYVIETKNQLRDEARDLQREKERLEGLKGLQDIETPFGTLPVGIDELVLLFPVLVAAGFMLMAALFVESLELRQEYRLLTRLMDPDGAVLPDRRIALIAPLWIDPLKPLPQRAYRAAILGLPLLVFLGAIGLLARNRLLTGPFIEEARLNAAIYYGLYIAGAVTLLEGSRRIVRALRRQAGEGQESANVSTSGSDPDAEA